jgi:hypothetical protein
MGKRYHRAIIQASAFFLFACFSRGGSESYYPHSFLPTSCYADKKLQGMIDHPEKIPENIELFPLKGAVDPVIGIASHHLLVYPVIDAYFKNLKTLKNDIKTFVIITPNHYDRGYQPVSVFCSLEQRELSGSNRFSNHEPSAPRIKNPGRHSGILLRAWRRGAGAVYPQVLSGLRDSSRLLKRKKA